LPCFSSNRSNHVHVESADAYLTTSLLGWLARVGCLVRMWPRGWVSQFLLEQWYRKGCKR
jgi:hypothetical protein